MQNPLDAFLDAQQAEGRYFDTSGFTLDSVRALQKLSLHQLPNSGLWVVKLVQAAVAAGAPSVSIAFERKKVRVKFRPAVVWQADDILAALLSGTFPSDRALGHLVTGLRSATGAGTEQVGWTCGTAQVLLGDQRCQVTDSPYTEEFEMVAVRPSRSRTLSHTLTSSLTDLVKQTVEESDALRSRCWVCPIPIAVDGKQLPRGYDLTDAGFLQRSPLGVLTAYESREKGKMHVCLGIRPLAGGSRERLPYQLTAQDWPELSEAVKPVFRAQTFFRWPAADGESWGAVAVVFGSHEHDPRIYHVLDGAAVASQVAEPWRLTNTRFLGIEVKRNAQIRGIVAVEPSDLDLSGFALRETNLEALLTDIAPHLRELVDKTLARMNDFIYLPMTKKGSPWVGLGLGAQLTFITAVSQGLALLPIGAMMAGLTAFHVHQWRSQAKGVLEELQKLLAA